MSLVISVLTGLRPNMLERTLKALRAFHGPLIESAYTVALHNGGDEETAEILKANQDMFNMTVVSPTFMDLGEATSTLFGMAVERGKYLLHIEDDWEAQPGEWYDQAKALLEDNVFQVRLRRYEEPVLVQHMVTKKRIVWDKGDLFHYTKDAHYTLNPSLVRMVNIAKGWPSLNERQAQQKLWRAKKRKVAQLVPGIFSHIGGEDSLRKKVEKSSPTH